MKVQKGDTNRV